MDMLKYIFIGGKGGVGKSTISSALALKHSRLGKKVLLISTDPAHNLCDIFGFSNSPNIQKIDTNLDILEIDAKQAANEYLSKVARDTKRFVKTSSYALMDDYFAKLANSANAKESALFDKLVRTLIKPLDYDLIIIDTAPTGHTLRFFSTPLILTSFLDKIILKSKKAHDALLGQNCLSSSDFADDNLSLMLDTLEERRLIYEDFAKLLYSNKCAINLVAIPSKSSLNESIRAKDELKKSKLFINSLFINMIFPKGEDAFLRAQNKIQEEYILALRKSFANAKIFELNYLTNELFGKNALDDFIALL